MARQAMLSTLTWGSMVSTSLVAPKIRTSRGVAVAEPAGMGKARSANTATATSTLDQLETFTTISPPSKLCQTVQLAQQAIDLLGRMAPEDHDTEQSSHCSSQG